MLTLPRIAVYTQSAPHKSEQPLLATSGILCSNNNEGTPCQSMAPRYQTGFSIVYTGNINQTSSHSERISSASFRVAGVPS